MKLIVIWVESSFHVIPYLTWKWYEFVIFFYLINQYKFMSDHLYFPNNLKNIKDQTRNNQ